MIIINNINKHFAGNSLISVDTTLIVSKIIEIEDLVFFVDKNNYVKSINVLSNLKYGIKEKKFYTANLDELDLIKRAALDNNLIIKDKPKFIYVEILKREIHPKSNKLFVLTVTDLQREFQIVTNTLDSLEGRVLVCALPGSLTSSGLEILPGKVMDIESNGMVVGYKTLSFDKEGLIFGTKENIGKEFII